MFENNNRIRFKYDTSGRKLCEIYELYHSGIPPSFELESIAEGESMTASGYYTTASRRDYCGNHIYQNGRLSMVITPAGYITGGMRYYYIKDYQGNNRVVLNQNGVVQQINHYYPYGSLMGEGYNASSQPYRYGGKELVTLGGLNLSDFDARWLDSPSGSFTTMDPLCENFYATSPYIYCAANPIKYIDPTGMDYRVTEYNNYYQIDAIIYTNTKSAELTKSAADIWNNFEMEYEGKPVKFNIEVVEVGEDARVVTAFLNKDKTGYANAFIVDDNKFKRYEGYQGITRDGVLVFVRGKTSFDINRIENAAHEIGHILGLEHSTWGLMTSNHLDSHRCSNIGIGDLKIIILQAKKRKRIHPESGKGIYIKETDE